MLTKINNKISIRLLKNCQTDYNYLYKWYQNKEVNTYFEQRELSMEEIINKYQPRTKEDSLVTVYMIEYNNNHIGIIQYQPLTKDSKEKYHIPCEGFDLDIFIGNSSYYNKGLGSEVIKHITKKLLTKNNILTMVPDTDNRRAIACYKKAGFTISSTIKDYDTLGKKLHDKTVMIIKKKIIKDLTVLFICYIHSNFNKYMI